MPIVYTFYPKIKKWSQLAKSVWTYYYSADNKVLQQTVFADQIRIANEVDKPVIIHTRSAPEDTIAMLREHHAEKCGGLIHCFTETLDFAKKALDLGFYISLFGHYYL